MAVAPASTSAGTRERLSRTALRLFAERGYNGVSNREIVEACGLTKGAIYWYFESKEHLFRSVLAETLASWQLMVSAAINGSSRWQDKLAAVFRLFVTTMESEDDPHRDMLLLLVQHLPSGMRGPGQIALAQASQQRLMGWIEDVLADHAGSADRASVAALIRAAGLGLLVQGPSAHGDARSVLDALLGLLGGDPLFPAPPSPTEPR